MTVDSVSLDLARSVHATFFRAMIEIRRHYLKTSALNLTQASILSILTNQGPVRATELASLEDVQAPTMKLRIDRLEAQGLVKRQTDPKDARVTRIAITARGVRAHETAINDVLLEMLGELNTTELRRLQQALRPLGRLVDSWRDDD